VEGVSLDLDAVGCGAEALPADARLAVCHGPVPSLASPPRIIVPSGSAVTMPESSKMKHAAWAVADNAPGRYQSVLVGL
jgi:hypothetical protein